MKVALINGSPKSKDSASGELLRDLKSCVSEEVVCEEFCLQKPNIENEFIMALEGFDALVFAYPLYVDGIQNKNRMVYGIAMGNGRRSRRRRRNFSNGGGTWLEAADKEKRLNSKGSE